MIVQRWPARPVLAVVAAALCVVLQGCGLTGQQRGAVQRFSAATADLGTLAAEEFRQDRADEIQLNTLAAALGSAGGGSQVPELDRFFTVERVRVRVEAADALKEYGRLLFLLATDSQADQLQGAASSLVGSLRRVRGVSLSDGQATAIGAAVQAVGGLAVESMRMEALREVVQKTGPAITQVVEVIKADLEPDGERWSLGYDATVDRVGAWAARVKTDSPIVGQAVATAAATKTRFREIQTRIVGAADALVLAERDLKMALVSPAYTLEDLEPYFNKVQELVTVYKILRTR